MKKILLYNIAIIFLIMKLTGCNLNPYVNSSQVRADFRTFYPEARIKGWELNKMNTGLKENYSKLTKFNVKGADYGKGKYIDGYLTIYGNQTIENKLITWALFCDISAGNLTFRNCLFQPMRQSHGTPILNATSNTVIEDCEIDTSLCPQNDVNWSIGIVSSGVVRRCNIHGMSTGISINNNGSTQAICENNYVHDLVWKSGTDAHPDGITTRISNGSGGVLVIGNRVDISVPSSAVYFSKANFGKIDNLIIRDNLFQGTTYCICIDNTGAHSYGSHIQIVNNRMTLYSGYGVAACAITPQIWIDNHLYDSNSKDGKGEPIYIGRRR